MSIKDAHQKIPLMFRSQIPGRSQLHYPNTGDARRWVSEWSEKVYQKPILWGEEVKSVKYSFNWRFVTNGGQDDNMIRPVIGAMGLPFYPGSSMKGAFRRVCNQEQIQRYCGKELSGGDSAPGILRFHGGYPTKDYDWTENLLDLVHPQQGWQVETNNTRSKPGGESAFALVSLYQPEFSFAISSTVSLTESEWQTIWQLWEKAIASGLGCRVSAGYGQPQGAKIPGDAVISSFHLKGEGLTAKTLDETPEFRPNMFKAAIRGHALRILGGITDADNAKSLVETLFGGVTGEGKVGLVKMYWQNFKTPRFSKFEDGYGEDIYQVDGVLKWLFTSPIESEKKTCLSQLIRNLTRFAMLLGGFGKSWRRADHDLFYPDYYERRKPLIGCHWQYGEKSLNRGNLVTNLHKVGSFLDKVRESARVWMRLNGITPSDNPADWREAWHPNKVQVWARIAEDEEDSQAIKWFHGAYQREDRRARIQEGSIYRSNLTGRMSQVGRIWHRMYPKFKLLTNPDEPKKPKIVSTNEYLEILTIFADNSAEFAEFQDFLQESQASGRNNPFQLVWGSIYGRH